MKQKLLLFCFIFGFLDCSNINDLEGEDYVLAVFKNHAPEVLGLEIEDAVVRQTIKCHPELLLKKTENLYDSVMMEFKYQKERVAKRFAMLNMGSELLSIDDLLQIQDTLALANHYMELNIILLDSVGNKYKQKIDSLRKLNYSNYLKISIGYKENSGSFNDTNVSLLLVDTLYKHILFKDHEYSKDSTSFFKNINHDDDLIQATCIDICTDLRKHRSYIEMGMEYERKLISALLKMMVFGENSDESSYSSDNSSPSPSSSQLDDGKSKNEPKRIVVEQHRDPVPVQQWQACFGCGGMGTMGCDNCGGSGTKYIGDRLYSCSRCNGRGIIPCNVCYGNRGQYVTVYK